MKTDELALLVSAIGLVVALVALIVAILDWHQVGREEPWNLTKVQEDIWVLERVHRRPVVITYLLNFHGSEVRVLNDAGMPAAHFRRGRKEVLQIRPTLGTSLSVFSRRYPLRLRAWDRLSRIPGLARVRVDRFAHLRMEPSEAMKGDQWHTPLY
ncbi:hypothetical protein MG599_23495 (plasmid) [Paenarthrobacter sp. SD-1]|uniref:Uncharacterized protein n=1 Tax=Paenarthrobacter ureafaciens TaxID=37931 RepID=A0AAX3EQP9_PAEUR|nr:MULTISPECIES: hypothetical protein [Paenarthrobacter]MDO5878235.1 hypothetical protein [Paenarthrobacter sp. SD-1]UYV95557.1 hypothetical protein NL395_23065 [Paenarthrobacter ureafaciens]UYW00157.1 hypothetical protein NL394_23450 [Paenarthrobacter ureafaciens]